MEQIKTEKLVSPDLMSHEEIEQLLPCLDEIIGWAKQVQEFALNQALQGEKYEGFKVVAGRSVRKFEDEDKVADTLIGEGYEESMIFERKLATITKLEALIGKKKFATLLGNLVVKPLGKPTLAPDTDDRPEYEATSSAADDFKN